MKETGKTPGVQTANWTYLIMIILLYGLSSVLIPLIGIGINLWINELFWLLGLVLFISWKKEYSFRETFNIRKAPKGVLFLSAIIGLAVWFPSVFIYSLVEKVVALNFGPYNAEIIPDGITQIVFLIIGTVVLAPLCEEFFFRGFMQKAYDGYNKKYSWVIVGVLFGVFHIGNGISDVLSATILGVLIGYVVFLTHSIWPAVVLHALNNFAAIFLSQIRLTISKSDVIPAWFIVVMLISIALIFISFVVIRKNFRGEVGLTNEEASDKQTETPESRNDKLNLLPLAVAAVIFLVAGFSEISLRGDSLKTGNVDSGHSKIAVGENKEDSVLTLAAFEIKDHETYQFEWTIDLKSDYNAIILKAIAPDGSIFFEEGPIISPEGMTYKTKQSIEIRGEGKWQFLMEGRVKGLEVSILWNLKKQD